MDLDALRAENIAAWSRDPVLPDFAQVANTSSAKYIPALEAEVERLREDLRIANEATLVLLRSAAASKADAERMRAIRGGVRVVGHHFKVDL